MDLDDEELKATREMNGANKKKTLEQYIEIHKALKKHRSVVDKIEVDYYFNIVDELLAERKKIIKDLEKKDDDLKYKHEIIKELEKEYLEKQCELDSYKDILTGNYQDYQELEKYRKRYGKLEEKVKE